MKLYLYDHCPYCVRTRMIVGLKNLTVEEITLLNDDESTPISLIGKKMVPILIKEDGSAMGESLDIVRYLDENYGDKPCLDEYVRPQIEAWCTEVGGYYYRLLHPRCVQIGLNEFATTNAIAYFVNKKSERIGDFAENIEQSAQYIERLEQDLVKLERLMKSENTINDELSYEDILVFPMLRNLTCVKGLHFPTSVKTYIEQMAKATKIPLFYQHQI